MEFGRLDDYSQVDFTLPPDPVMTSLTLRAATDTNELQVYVGATKWAEPRWKASWYPKGTADVDFVQEYARQFNTIEFNPTFYAIYKPEALAKWAAKAAVNPEFKFCPKFPQIITHQRGFVNTDRQTKEFYESLKGFGDHLGPTLIQTGEFLGPKNFVHLKNYLGQLPASQKVFIEIRNKNWLDKPANRDDFFSMLQLHRVGACISDTPGRRDLVHMTLTVPHAMIRFQGTGLDKIENQRLEAWVERIAAWKEQGLQSVYMFVHQHNEPDTPYTIKNLIEKLNGKLGMNIRAPVRYDG